MAISLNDHEKRIKDFEGQLSSIDSKITTLENKPPAKDWAIVRVNLDRSGVGYFDDKYINHKKRICAYSMRFSFDDGDRGHINVEVDMYDLTVRIDHNIPFDLRLSVSGNRLKVGYFNYNHYQLRVSFRSGYVELLCYT